MAFGQVESLKM